VAKIIEMVTVQEADKIISSHTIDFGTESLPFDRALNTVLAEDIAADRDIPPYNRVTMDGIAIRYADFADGCKSFKILTTQAAGDVPINAVGKNECVEIMTGAAIPPVFDTVIRYEDVLIDNGIATVTIDLIKAGQNIHRKGSDKKQNDILAFAGQIIDATIVNIAASVGKMEVLVKKLPKVVVVTTGDELVDVTETPNDFQVRRSNSYAIKASLETYGIDVALKHIADDRQESAILIKKLLEVYDVIVLSGGVSKGKYDYLPSVFEELSVEQLFHGVKQRPGKPFWFGKHNNGALVFAFPGNPVSTFMCLHRYLVPWLKQSLGLVNSKEVYAVLTEDVTFKPALQYFLQVKIEVSSTGQLTAQPMEGNGSGDFANLLNSNAFMELPMERDNFKKGEVFKVWSFKSIC
jgi:molybdopterin molybdotransferase